MISKYIFIKKDKTPTKDDEMVKDIEKMFKSIFFNVENKQISLTEDDSSVIKYKMANGENNSLFLIVKCENSEMTAAKTLDKFSYTLTQGKHRKDYYIINSYNEASHTFCSKLMPILGEFERLVREFIYITVVKGYGADWVSKTISEDTVKHIKKDLAQSKSSVNLIEAALEWFTISEIEDYLFTPFSEKSPEDVLNNILSEDNIDNLSREEIVEAIKLTRRVSLWTRLFQRYKEFDDFEKELNDIRKIRNDVMHNKSMSFEYYSEARKKVISSNAKLISAISTISDMSSIDIKHVLDIDISAITKAVLLFAESTGKYKNSEEKLQKFVDTLGYVLGASAKSLRKTKDDIKKDG